MGAGEGHWCVWICCSSRSAAGPRAGRQAEAGVAGRQGLGHGQAGKVFQVRWGRVQQHSKSGGRVHLAGRPAGRRAGMERHLSTSLPQHDLPHFPSASQPASQPIHPTGSAPPAQSAPHHHHCTTAPPPPLHHHGLVAGAAPEQCTRIGAEWAPVCRSSLQMWKRRSAVEGTPWSGQAAARGCQRTARGGDSRQADHGWLGQAAGGQCQSKAAGAAAAAAGVRLASHREYRGASTRSPACPPTCPPAHSPAHPPTDPPARPPTRVVVVHNGVGGPRLAVMHCQRAAPELRLRLVRLVGLHAEASKGLLVAHAVGKVLGRAGGRAALGECSAL